MWPCRRPYRSPRLIRDADPVVCGTLCGVAGGCCRRSTSGWPPSSSARRPRAVRPPAGFCAARLAHSPPRRRPALHRACVLFRNLLPARLRQGHRRRRRPGPPRRGRRLPVRAAAVRLRSGYPVHRVIPDVPDGLQPPRKRQNAQRSRADERSDRRLDRPGDGGGHRHREISCSELMDLHLARIAESEPPAERDRQPRRGAGPRRGQRGRPDAVRRAGPLHGLPWAFKDTHDVAGWLHDVRLAAAPRPRPGPRRAGRRADPAGRGGADRQDQRAGVRGGEPHVQHRVRHDAQPGRPHAVTPAGRAGERRAR